MRRTLALAAFLLFVGSVGSAQFKVDDDMMREIEDTTKSLDSNIATRNAKAAETEARELAGVFEQIQAYYAAQSDGAQGVTHSQKGRQLVLAVLEGVRSQDFDVAANTLNDFTRNCKACHQVYKRQ